MENSLEQDLQIQQTRANLNNIVFGGNKKENNFYLFLFLVVCLGGAIRKWVIASEAIGNVVLLIQLTLPFLMHFFRSDNSISPFQKYKILGLYFFYLVVQVFNPLQVTIFHGILGIVVHGGMWLAFYFYLANRHLFNPARYIKLFVIVAFGEIVLAFIQYQLPHDHFLNRYALDVIKYIALVGTRVRVTGTFSYLSGYTAFLVFFPFFIWALIRLKYNSWIISMASGFGLVAAFMTGSRGGVVLYTVLLGPIFFTEYNFGLLAKFAWKLVLPLAIGGTMLLLAKKVTIGDQIVEAYTNFSDRVKATQESGEQNQRLTWDIAYLKNNNFRFPIFGIGTGATYQGATILFGASPYAKEFGHVEIEPIKILLEGGIVLVAFKIILASILVANLSFKGPVKWVIWVILVYAAPVVFNPHNAVFIFLGVTLIDNIIWRQEAFNVKKLELDLAESLDENLP